MLDRVRAAEARAGRPAGSVEVVAVSKLQPAEAIRAAYAAGARAFGENYAQELPGQGRGAGRTSPGSAGTPSVPCRPTRLGTWRGPRTSSTPWTGWRWPGAVARRTGSPLAVFVEVNVGGEGTKSGVAPEVARGAARGGAARCRGWSWWG